MGLREEASSPLKKRQSVLRTVNSALQLSRFVLELQESEEDYSEKILKLFSFFRVEGRLREGLARPLNYRLPEKV